MRDRLPLAVLCATVLLLYHACKDRSPGSSIRPAFIDEGVHMVVQHPAGTLPSDRAAWPAPGNMGTVPSTVGEDGRPLACLLIGGTVEAGSTQLVLPIAATQWRAAGKISTCIAAVPVDAKARTCAAEDYITLRMQYEPLRTAVELWLRHAYMPEGADWLGWQNEVYAEEEVYRCAQRFVQQTPK